MMATKYFHVDDGEYQEFLAVTQTESGCADVYSVSSIYGELYYGVFSDEFNATDEENIEEFLIRNETNGWGCGSFQSIEDLTADIRRSVPDLFEGYEALIEKYRTEIEKCENSNLKGE